MVLCRVCALRNDRPAAIEPNCTTRCQMKFQNVRIPSSFNAAQPFASTLFAKNFVTVCSLICRECNASSSSASNVWATNIERNARIATNDFIRRVHRSIIQPGERAMGIQWAKRNALHFRSGCDLFKMHKNGYKMVNGASSMPLNSARSQLSLAWLNCNTNCLVILHMLRCARTKANGIRCFGT